jgi:hypothetical protein
MTLLYFLHFCNISVPFEEDSAIQIIILMSCASFTQGWIVPSFIEISGLVLETKILNNLLIKDSEVWDNSDVYAVLLSHTSEINISRFLFVVRVHAERPVNVPIQIV